MENIKIYSNLERVLAHSVEMERILGDEAFKLTLKARSRLAAHHKTGNHKITQNKGRVDHFVNLEGRAPLSVEKGWHDKQGEFHPGLHILRGSIGGTL